MVKRECADCSDAFKTIVYKRLTPIPTDLNMYKLFYFNWFDSINQVNGFHELN